MKKIIFFLTLLLPVSSYAQGRVATEAFGVQVTKFAPEGGNMVVQVAFDLDARKINTRERWEVTPVIEATGHARELLPFVVSGQHRARMFRRAQKLGRSVVKYGAQDAVVYEVLRRGATRSVTYRATVPWQDWMDGGSLCFKTRIIACGNTIEEGHECLGVLETIPVVVDPRPSYVPPVREAVKERSVLRTAYIDFKVNRSAVDRALNNNAAELAAIEATLNEIHNSPDVSFRGIALTGYASPEGSYNNNDRLAAERVNALRDYVASHFGIDPGQVTVNHVAEDWDGLRRKVEQSGLEDKAAVLEIIDNPSYEPDARETALKALGGGATWRTILQDMMPSLRRTDYCVEYTVRNYDLARSREILQTKPELLSHYELDVLAREYDPASKEYAQIYNLIEVQNPTSDNANVNVAANYIARQNWLAAGAALQRVKNRDAAYWNNYGIVQMMMGKAAEAAEAFRRAGTTDAQYNALILEKNYKK